MLNGSSKRLGLPTYNYVYEKIAGDEYMVYLKEFPYLTAVAKTKAEAKAKLDIDLLEVSKIDENNHQPA